VVAFLLHPRHRVRQMHNGQIITKALVASPRNTQSSGRLASIRPIFANPVRQVDLHSKAQKDRL
jgi:hypothetical protein